MVDPSSENVQGHYGPLKALCEEVVTDAFGERALVVRSGLIVGPFDPTGRFIYWALRLGRSGEVLGPGAPERHVQFIDARDQVAWILDMTEARRGGTFNVAGPARPLTFTELLSRCAGPVTWVHDQFLLDEGVEPYTEMPLWLPASVGNLNMPIERALATGLHHRDVDETLRDTRVWAEFTSDRSRMLRCEISHSCAISKILGSSVAFLAISTEFSTGPWPDLQRMKVRSTLRCRVGFFYSLSF
jgi:2'-hydroxyisoflavone reductase